MFETRILTTEYEPPAFIVVPVGEVGGFVSEQVSLEVDDVLGELDEFAAKHVVVDFGDVTFFGSCLLAAIQRIWKHLTPIGGNLVLCNVPEVGREVLHVSRFDELWPVYDSREEAKKAFSA
jgi:anti-anti-sigma factor